MREVIWDNMVKEAMKVQNIFIRKRSECTVAFTEDFQELRVYNQSQSIHSLKRKRHLIVGSFVMINNLDEFLDIIKNVLTKQYVRIKYEP